MKFKYLSAIFLAIWSNMGTAAINEDTVGNLVDKIVEQLKSDTKLDWKAFDKGKSHIRTQFCEAGGLLHSSVRSLLGSKCSTPLGAALAQLVCSDLEDRAQADFDQSSCARESKKFLLKLDPTAPLAETAKKSLVELFIKRPEHISGAQKLCQFLGDMSLKINSNDLCKKIVNKAISDIDIKAEADKRYNEMMGKTN